MTKLYRYYDIHMHTSNLCFLFLATSYYTNRTGLAKRPSFGMYRCSGTESSLLNCPHSIIWSWGWFVDDFWCGRTRVVGIKCPSLPGQL